MVGENKNVSQQDSQNNCSDLLKQIESIKRKQRLLRIVTIFLSVCIIVIIAITWNFYRNYKNIEKSFNYVLYNNDFDDKYLNKMMDEIYTTTPTYSTNISTISSLSMITFSTEIVNALKDESTKKNIEEVANEYLEDKDVRKFIEKMKEDKDFKEIFQASDEKKPLLLFKKMQDPIFMDKYMKMIISDPSLLKAMIKMTSDPRLKDLMKNFSIDFSSINLSTTNK